MGHYRSKGSNNFGVAARGEAKRYAKLIGLDRSCIICGYTFYLHLAHVKPLSQFDDSEIMSTTWKDNVVYLCPNHHYEYDHGKINL